MKDLKKIKYVFSDLDGTLFLENKNLEDKVDKELVESINNLSSSDLSFSIATGRDYLNAKKVLELNGLQNYQYIIGCNGAQIYSRLHNQLIFVRTFIDEEMDYLFKAWDYISKKYPNELYLYGYVQGKDFTHITFYIKENEVNYVLNEINKMEELYKNIGIGLLVRKTYSKLLFKYAYKMSISFVNANESIEKKLNILNEIESKFPELSYYLSGTIEVTPKLISKYSAIKYLNNKYLKIDDNQIAVFGDEGNDLAMLYYFQNSFTRSSASEYIKKITKNIVDEPAGLFVKKIINKIINDKK